MKLIYILRFLRGFVVFEIYGGFTERFINLCAVNNILLWDVEINDSHLTASILCKNFKKLRPVIKKSGCKAKIKEKYGLPFFLNKHKNRVGLLFSAAFLAVFFVVMNQFVWIIDVTGTDTMSHEEIISYVEQCGLKIGTYVPSADTVAISRTAVNHFNGRLMWMAINIKGSKAVIEVRDYIDEHEDKQFKDPCNLLADFDGTILSVEVFNGDKEVHEGSAVKKGDLLISGVVENMDLSVNYCEARGRITALHNIKYNKSYPEKTTEYSFLSQTKTVYSINIFGADIPIGYANQAEFNGKTEYDRFLCYNGNKLPFGIGKTVYYKTSNENNRTKPEALICLDDFTAEFYEKFKNTNILSTSCILKHKYDKFYIESDLECIDFIGQQHPIYAEFYEN